ncbi:MAG: phosphopyruvate hydratase [Simkania sp.]|nr:phosphopyruvate hydratase [Simkania sp.]
MSRISSVTAIEILDSRGNPTLLVTVVADCGCIGKAAVPSGASTGEREAVELRDGDPKRFGGKGVLKAVSHVNGPLAKALIGEDLFAQRALDEKMIHLDGTPNKSKLGANAILGVSMAIARCAASASKTSLYRYLGGEDSRVLPCPMFNIVNGGAHADNLLDFQEFMICPVGAMTCKEAIRWGAEIFHTLKKLLQEQGYTTSVGDEGGFAPRLKSNEDTLDIILKAIEKAGYRPGEQVSLAIDCAASEFFDTKHHRYIEKKKQQVGESQVAQRSSEEQIAYLKGLTQRYPIFSIEDPLDQNDWKGWQQITKELGNMLQIVGDDIFVTNLTYLRRGIEEKTANAILIKLNQIGTLSETIDAIVMAKRHGFRSVISHRSGETEDSFIADLAVGLQTGQIKTGSLSRSDRIAKYNRLLEIEENLAGSAIYASRDLF